MAPISQAPGAALHLTPLNHHDGLKLVDVEGDLERSSEQAWAALLRGAIELGASGLAVDLRACRIIDPACLGALLAAAALMKAHGGPGVTVIVMPGSSISDRFETDSARRLPTYDSAVGALEALIARDGAKEGA